jgi:hypothetical protein
VEQAQKDVGKKAETSIRTVFAQYCEKEEAAQVLEEPEERSGGGYHDDEFEKNLAVDISLPTGEDGFKVPKIHTELNLYFSTIRTDIRDPNGPLQQLSPVEWWHKEGRASYPTLFKMAMDFLSISATSYECERAFSGGKRTITVDRNHPKPATIEALQLQKN